MVKNYHALLARSPNDNDELALDPSLPDFVKDEDHAQRCEAVIVDLKHAESTQDPGYPAVGKIPSHDVSAGSHCFHLAHAHGILFI